MGSGMDAVLDLVMDADTRQTIEELRREVLRDRDKFSAASHGLRFVWQPMTHPHPGMLWDHRTAAMRFESGWMPAGSWLCGITLPTQKGDDLADYQVYIQYINERACSKLIQHGNEMAALLRRLGAKPMREQETQLFRELFEVNRLANTLLWTDNEEPGRPTTRSCVATVPDVFQAIATFLGALLDVFSPVDPKLNSTPIAKEPSKFKKMTRAMAESYAERLAKTDLSFVIGTAEEWAKRIAQMVSKETGVSWTCSVSTVSNIEFWKGEMKRQSRGREGRSVTAGSFSDKMAASVGQADDILEDMVAKEEQPAIDAVMQSGMDNKGKAAAIKRIKDGEMSVTAAFQMAAMFPAQRK